MLNDSGPVSDVTRRRIERVASRLRYAPNGAARSLITRRTHTIGVLLPDLYGEFFSEVIRGIDLVAQRSGYHMLVSSSHSEQQALREYHPDVLVVAAYGLILPQAVLDIPRLGAFNIHASLLPRWRGARGHWWAAVPGGRHAAGSRSRLGGRPRRGRAGIGLGTYTRVVSPWTATPLHTPQWMTRSSSTRVRGVGTRRW